MGRTLKVKYSSKEIEFSDLDSDGHCEVVITSGKENHNFYLNEDDLISLGEHVQYLINKLN